MAILDFTGTAQAPSRGNTSTRRMPFGEMSNMADRPRAKVWLNIGYEANGKFINLPIGLPIDTMEAAEVRGQNSDWVKQRNAQNALLEALKKAGASLEPGQEQEVNLSIRIRRVNEELVVESTSNEYAVDFSSLLVTTTQAETEIPEAAIA